MSVKKKAKMLVARMANPAFMPRVMERLQKKQYDEGMQIMGEAARYYFDRISKPMEGFNKVDAPIVAKLLRHMANEMERADPYIANTVKAMEKIEFPPIDYTTKK